MNKNKTSIVFTGDIGFDRYMDKRWEDDNLLSPDVLAFFHSADHAEFALNTSHGRGDDTAALVHGEGQVYTVVF